MGKRIYCGNLSFQATDEEVRTLFSPHGQVTDVHIVTDRETGRSRGFAFVEMASDDQAKAAIQALDGSQHANRTLKVNEAQPRQDRGGGGGFGGGGGGGFGGGGRGGRGGGGGHGRY
jgi:RNA recognition motif-containing protein